MQAPGGSSIGSDGGCASGGGSGSRCGSGSGDDRQPRAADRQPIDAHGGMYA